MQLAFTAHLPFRLSRPARSAAPELRRTAPAPRSSFSARRAAAPQDSAFYTCSCGFAFTAAVSTTVGCPHCGTQQAW